MGHVELLWVGRKAKEGTSLTLGVENKLGNAGQQMVSRVICGNS